MEKIGGWAFLAGVVLAILLGLFGSLTATVGWVLVVLGIIVGLINITEKESAPFMTAGTVLVIVTALSGNVFSALPLLPGIFNALLLLFVPATIVVAIKTVFGYAKKK